MAQRQRQKEKVSQKLELALELIRTPWDNLAPALSQGRVPGPEATYVRELAELVDNGDQVQTRDLGPLLLLRGVSPRPLSIRKGKFGVYRLNPAERADED